MLLALKSLVDFLLPKVTAKLLLLNSLVEKMSTVLSTISLAFGLLLQTKHDDH